MARAITTQKRKIAEWKKREVAELVDLLRKYKVILIVDLSGMPTAQLQKIRRKIWEKYSEKMEVRVTKNTLFKIALKQAGVDPTPFEPYLTGNNMFIFTNENPFRIALELDKIRVFAPAKPGDKAPSEIVLPAGDTGLKPGPIMSVFGKLRVPIRVQGGSIWIAKDTVVAKPGDKISFELASLLQKLGIEPIEVKLKFKAAYDSGVVIPGDQLLINLEEYKNLISEAYRNALAVGVEIALPEPEVLKLALPLAARRALWLAAEIGYVTPETAEVVLSLAVRRAYALLASLGDLASQLGVEIVQPPAEKPAEEVKEEKEEKAEEEKEEGVGEEQLAAGLEALFGG